MTIKPLDRAKQALRSLFEPTRHQEIPEPQDNGQNALTMGISNFERQRLFDRLDNNRTFQTFRNALLINETKIDAKLAEHKNAIIDIALATHREYNPDQTIINNETLDAACYARAEETLGEETFENIFGFKMPDNNEEPAPVDDSPAPMVS